MARWEGWADGKTMMDMAEEQGITREELQSNLEEIRKSMRQERLQALVDGGVITQEQADHREAFMAQQTAAGNQGFGMHHGFGMGMRGRHGY